MSAVTHLPVANLSITREGEEEDGYVFFVAKLVFPGGGASLNITRDYISGLLQQLKPFIAGNLNSIAW